ncbi:hypothetical protein HY768_04650 [candidate division TA06 bacterium]|uniref:Uncharacterized protein n=1 Tax=candidate division TA06 bacterium TaxID=2250710 RepID=A0A933IDK4_UNCT6|nr:hypothetical protein [candidate division TA06 bacterium]
MKKTLLFAALAALILGCAQKEAPKPVAAPAPAKPVPAFVASVNFIKGDVQKLLSGTWMPAVPGDSLFAGDCLNIPAKAELEFKDAQGQLLKLTGSQTDEVTTLLQKAAATPEAKPESKAIQSLKKIEGKKQTLTEQTPTAVAGIRGTQKRKPMPDTTAASDTTK